MFQKKLGIETLLKQEKSLEFEARDGIYIIKDLENNVEFHIYSIPEYNKESSFRKIDSDFKKNSELRTILLDHQPLPVNSKLN